MECICTHGFIFDFLRGHPGFALEPRSFLSAEQSLRVGQGPIYDKSKLTTVCKIASSELKRATLLRNRVSLPHISQHKKLNPPASHDIARSLEYSY